MDIFGQSLSHKSFTKQNRGKLQFSQIFTTSDEAFLIFTLARCWEPWYNEYANNQGVAKKGRYTVENSNQKNGGFKEEGIRVYNQICEEVKEMRNSGKRKVLELQYMKKYALQQVQVNVDASGSIYQSRVPKKRKIIAYTDIDIMMAEKEGKERMQDFGKCIIYVIIML